MTQDLLFMLNHLWQSTVLAGVAWLACRTILSANSPRVRFGVWLVVSLKFLIPFAAFVAAGYRLGVRPLLTPAQSQQVFDIVGGGRSGLAMVPFRTVSPIQPVAAGEKDVLLVVLAILWALGTVVVLLRWFKSWRKIRHAARNAV